MLSKKARYALHALVRLAQLPAGESIGSDALSKQAHLPKKFLESILTELTKAGMVRSKRGKGGGYGIRKSPSDIPLVDVIRLFDGAIGIIPCVTYKYFSPCDECVDPDACSIRSIFKEQRDLNVAFLKNKHISDLIPQQ